jgi:endoglucanase
MKVKNSKTHRAFLLAECGTIFLSFLASARSQEVPWNIFKQRFVAAEGRVIDDANNDVSHSESQGYGLLLATAHDDRETFDRIWKWTSENLRPRNDHLFAWLWKDDAGGGRVADTNNATDGDLLVAWALTRAGSLWGEAKLQDAAKEIARDIRKKMVRPSRYGPVLLPGEKGFEKPEGLVVNLSYWIFPAFPALAKIDPSPDWQLLEQSGLKLIEAARFSPWALPPDWLLLTANSMKLAEGEEPVYGYNAVRIPLYLAWAGIEPAEYYSSFRRIALSSLYPDSRPPPAKVILPSGESAKLPSQSYIEAASPGMIAIYELIAGTGDLRPGNLEAFYNEVATGEHYYSVSLGLLSNCAALESREISQ